MKKFVALLLCLCLCLGMAGVGSAEEGLGTIMWLSNISSGIQYEATRDYLTAICDAMGYDFTIVYGDSFDDAAGNLTAVSNGMTSDTVASSSARPVALLPSWSSIPTSTWPAITPT